MDKFNTELSSPSEQQAGMKQAHQTSGVYLIVVALGVAIQFIFESTYQSAEISPQQVWMVLDWFSFVGFALCSGLNFVYLRECSNRDVEVWKKVCSSAAFYTSIVLTLAFVHNFVASLAAGTDDLLFWKFINAVQIPLFLATGVRLLKH